jgi:three-Cys-motif partner protein
MADEDGESSGLEVIGPWTELKHEIVEKYAAAYSRILTARKLHHVYVDAFAGAGRYISKRSRLLVPVTCPHSLVHAL